MFWDGAEQGRRLIGPLLNKGKGQDRAGVGVCGWRGLGWGWGRRDTEKKLARKSGR